jgi:phage repressor protein C with HTH and peptisase S24 domain
MNKISNTQKRLKEIMSERGLKQVDIMKMAETYKKELDIKMPKNYLSQYVNGKSTPDNLRLVLLSKVLGVSEAWLMGYDVPRTDEEEESPLIEKTIENMKKLAEEWQENVLKFSKMQLDEQKAKERRRIKIEVIKPKEENTPLELHPVKVKEHISLAAGLGFSYDETGEYATYYTDRTDLKCFDEGFPVDGDSMEPEIHDNDIALVKYNYNKIDGCIYAFDYDGKSYIKYLYFYDDRIVVKSANKDKYKDWEINFEELAYDGYTHFKIVGEVVDWFTPEVV